MTNLSYQEIMYNVICSKKGHKFIKECKVKNCCKSIGRHSHDDINSFILIPVRKDKLACINCGEWQK
jgi:hypothetical protein